MLQTPIVIVTDSYHRWRTLYHRTGGDS